MTCKTHPDAPHGFDRGASHTLDRYVCECEFWEEPKMNERIKELADRCFSTLPHEDELEKFAELIVRKCAMFCNDISEEAWRAWKSKYDPHDDGRSYGAGECEDAIRKYFGVKE